MHSGLFNNADWIESGSKRPIELNACWNYYNNKKPFRYFGMAFKIMDGQSIIPRLIWCFGYLLHFECLKYRYQALIPDL